MRYHTIDEELTSEPEILPSTHSDNPFPDHDPLNQEQQPVSISTKTTSKIVNFILLSMFFLAFIVDYVAMSSYLRKS